MESKPLRLSDTYPRFRRFDRVIHADHPDRLGRVKSLVYNPVMSEFNYVVEWDGVDSPETCIQASLVHPNDIMHALTMEINGLIDELRDLTWVPAPIDNADFGPIIEWTQHETMRCLQYRRLSAKLHALINFRTSTIAQS